MQGITGICFAGNIGSGKSTIATKLSQLLNVPLHQEVPDSKLLQKFYGNKTRYAYQLQIDLMRDRYLQLQRSIYSGEGNFSVFDRSIQEDEIFAKVLLEEKCLEQHEFDSVQEQRQLYEKLIPDNRVLVYLKVSPKKCLERIMKRGRPWEIYGLTLDYLERLHRGYQEFIKEQSRTRRVIVIEWEEDDQDVELVTKALLDALQNPSIETLSF